MAMLVAACGGDDAVDRAQAPAAQAQAPVRSGLAPRVGEPYPDLQLVDQTGRLTSLASLKGRVLLVEMIGMTCPACQGFSGAKQRGTFGGVDSDGGLPSIDDLLVQYARGAMLSDDLVLVQILLFDLKMGRRPRTTPARGRALPSRRREASVRARRRTRAPQPGELRHGARLPARRSPVRAALGRYRPHAAAQPLHRAAARDPGDPAGAMT
jgi:hypothetical protein